MTSRLQELLNIRICEVDSEQVNDLNNNSIVSNKNFNISRTTNKNNDKDISENKSCNFSNIDDSSILASPNLYDKDTSQLLSYNEFVDPNNNSSTIIEVSRGSNATDVISPPPVNFNFKL